MSMFAPPARGKAWLFQITALCIVLGVLFALSLKTQKQAAKEGVPLHMPDVRAAFRIIKQTNVGLQKELAEYKMRAEKLAKDQAAGLSSAKSLEQTLQEAKLLAGTVAARGPGIIVTLNDSNQLPLGEVRQDIIKNYVVHDTDIHMIVNELFASGAEAVSVNDQRWIANSSVRCAGPVVLVNSLRVAPPYIIKAVGKPETLEKALSLPGGVADGLFLLNMIDVKKAPDMVVPAYTGTTRFNVAKPVGEGR